MTYHNVMQEGIIMWMESVYLKTLGVERMEVILVDDGIELL